MMRIITGRARGVRLSTLEGKNTRPTAERTKEAVFSILQFEIEGKEVLDLFAGSGQMGLEAVSRGASHAVLCDSSEEAAEIIRKNTIKTKLAPDCTVFRGGFSECLRSMRGRRKFGLVFLDPPYALGLIPGALRGLIRNGLLAEGAWIVCESAEAEDVWGSDEELRERFEVYREHRYGAAQITVLRHTSEEKTEKGN